MPITHENQLRWRKLWLALSCAQASIVVYLSLTTRPHHLLGFTCGDKIEHLVVCFMLTFWISQLYSGDRARQRIAPASYWLRLRWKCGSARLMDSLILNTEISRQALPA